MNMNQLSEYVETDPTGRYGRVSRGTDSMLEHFLSGTVNNSDLFCNTFLFWNSLKKFLEGER